MSFERISIHYEGFNLPSEALKAPIDHVKRRHFVPVGVDLYFLDLKCQIRILILKRLVWR